MNERSKSLTVLNSAVYNICKDISNIERVSNNLTK
jgi:hypothetical protein